MLIEGILLSIPKVAEINVHANGVSGAKSAERKISWPYIVWQVFCREPHRARLHVIINWSGQTSQTRPYDSVYKTGWYQNHNILLL